MDDVSERSGRSYRSDTGVDDTLRDVTRNVSDAEEIQARKEAGFNFSRPTGVLSEHNARKEASPEELAIMAQMEEKNERKRQEALAAAATDIAIQKANMEQREMDARQAQLKAERDAVLQGAGLGEGQNEQQQPQPAVRENPVLSLFRGLKGGIMGLFSQRKPA